MLKIYKTVDEKGLFRETDKIEKGVWINLVNPSTGEINNLINSIGINEEFIKYSLDPEERARVDYENNQTLIIVDIPIMESQKGDYSTIPLGIIVIGDDYFITVCMQDVDIIKDFYESRIKDFYTFKKTRFTLQILYRNATYYLTYLKKINKQTDKTETRLQKDLRNEELIKLLALEKSLVYFTTSLKSNELVMERLLRGNVLKLYDDDKDYLQDAIIENKQAIEMVTISRDILTGTTNAYASIISNNLNIVMKFLAAVTIVFSIPTIVSGIWGMNVGGILFADNKYGFFIVIGIAIILSFVSYLWLKRKDMWTSKKNSK